MTPALLRILILPILIPDYSYFSHGVEIFDNHGSNKFKNNLNSNLNTNTNSNTNTNANTNTNSKTNTNSVGASLELQCPSCDKIHCTPKRPRKLKCKGGITRGVCNCCPVCAKVEGQSCGGIWNYLGRCDRGLICEPRLDQINVKTRLAEGVCQYSNDAGSLHPEHCSPKCSPDLCQHKNNLICSALGNALKTRSCQEDCQHTSCNLCRFKRELPNCKCGFNDFSCMQGYAKCMMARACFRKDRRCKGLETWLSKNKTFTLKWKFECIVPECQGKKDSGST